MQQRRPRAMTARHCASLASSCARAARAYASMIWMRAHDIDRSRIRAAGRAVRLWLAGAIYAPAREQPCDDVLEFVRGTRSHRSETRRGLEGHPGGDLGW